MKYSYWILLLVVGVFLACNKQNEPDLIISLEEEFEIGLWENLGAKERQFSLNLSTFKKTFECQNFEIALDQSQHANNLFVNIKDILEPMDCMLGNGRAEGQAEFSSLESKNYTLTINLKGQVTNEGILTVHPDYYQLSMNSQNGISLSQDKLYRVPENIVWGLIEHEDKTLTDAFLAEIETIATPITLEEGNYGYFKIEEGQLTIRSSLELTTPIAFVYLLMDTNADLARITQKYKEEYGIDFKANLFTAKGEVF